LFLKKIRPVKEIFEEMAQEAVQILTDRFSREAQAHR
jgi:hypothetical protein